MLTILKNALRLSLLLSAGYPAFAQSQASKYEVGINAGTFIYQGDLSPSTYGSFKTPGLVVGISGSQQINNNLAVRLDLNIGRLNGNEAKYKEPEWRQQRAFAFRDGVKEITASLVYYPLGIDRHLTPYVFGGAGLAHLNIRRDYSHFNAAYFTGESLDVRLKEDINHALPKSIPVLPVGAGIRYRITNQVSATAEASYRIMSTDYLDGFSKAANADLKDHYYKYAIGLLYGLKGKSNYDCPVINY
jgi:opacity protein-like surface antigen